MNESSFDLTYSSAQKICRVCLIPKNTRPMTISEVNCYQNIVSKKQLLKIEQEMTVCQFCGHLLRKYDKFSKQCQNAQHLLDGKSTADSTFFTLTHDMTTTIPKTYYMGPESIADEEFLIKFETNTYRTISNKNNIAHETNCESIANQEFILKTETDSDENNKQNETNCDELDDNICFEDENVFSDDDLPLVMLSKLFNDSKIKGKRKKKKTAKIKNKDPNSVKTTSGKRKEDNKSRRMKKMREGFTSRMVQETEEYLVIKFTKEQVLQEMRDRANSNKYKRSLYKCELCVKGFNFEDVLTSHIDKAHSKDKGDYKCELCSQYCKSIVSLRGHIKSHTTRYQCKVCGAVRLSRQHLLEHHHTAHSSNPPLYSCQHCPFNTNKRTVMQRHVRVSHSTTPRGFECARCGRRCTSMEALRVHVMRHDKHKALQCKQCGLKFIYPSLLEKHERTVHELAEYYCVECDIRFKCHYNLQLHYKKARRHRDPQLLRNITESSEHTLPQQGT